MAWPRPDRPPVWSDILVPEVHGRRRRVLEAILKPTTRHCRTSSVLSSEPVSRGHWGPQPRAGGRGQSRSPPFPSQPGQALHLAGQANFHEAIPCDSATTLECSGSVCLRLTLMVSLLSCPQVIPTNICAPCHLVSAGPHSLPWPEPGLRPLLRLTSVLANR